GPHKIACEHERYLALRTRLDQAGLSEAQRRAVGIRHLVRQEAEVRLMHTEHFLHGAAGQADLLADYALAADGAPLQKLGRNAISVVDRDFRIAFGKGSYSRSRSERGEQFAA